MHPGIQSYAARVALTITMTIVAGILVLPPRVAAVIEGYATATAVTQGDTLELHVSTEAPSYDVLIEDALEPSNVLRQYIGLPGTAFAVPESAFAWGCDWPVTHSVAIDPQWPSGVYYARLVAPQIDAWAGATPSVADTSFVPFVVLEDDPGSTSNIVFQLSTTTYNAYNAWGGRSLYPQNSQQNQRSYFVSFHRPYDEGRGKGQFPWWERPLAAWLRSEGIPVEYCTNLELHRNPDFLAPYRLFLSVGHDEYYSKPMYDQLEAFRETGGNLAFFAGNEIFWQVRFEGATMVCYKDLNLDPYYALGLFDLVTVNWRNPPLNRPEGMLIGVQYDSWCWRPCGEPIVPSQGSHWVLRGLGIDYTTPLGTQVVGYEWDHSYPGAMPEGLEILFHSPITNHAGLARSQQSSYYEYPARGQSEEEPRSRVFAAGTIQWSWGVRPDSAGADPRLVTISRRIVRCLSQPSVTDRDREVVFTADLRHIVPHDPVWLRGTPLPLTPDGTNFRMLDDGVPPDSAAGDQIFTRAVVFPAGSWDIVNYSYWTISRCGVAVHSAWIEDPELGPDPVRLSDRPAWCPATAEVPRDVGPELDENALLRVAVRRSGSGLRIEVTAPGAADPGRVATVAPFKVGIYDVTGRLVRLLADSRLVDGRAELRWPGIDQRGHRAPRGVYVVKVRAGKAEQATKVIW